MSRQHHQPETDRYWSATRLADFLSVSTKTINRWRKAGLIPAKELPAGGKYRYDPVQVEQVLTDYGRPEPSWSQPA